MYLASELNTNTIESPQRVEVTKINCYFIPSSLFWSESLNWWQLILFSRVLVEFPASTSSFSSTEQITWREQLLFSEMRIVWLGNWPMRSCCPSVWLGNYLWERICSWFRLAQDHRVPLSVSPDRYCRSRCQTSTYCSCNHVLLRQALSVRLWFPQTLKLLLALFGVFSLSSIWAMILKFERQLHVESGYLKQPSAVSCVNICPD